MLNAQNFEHRSREDLSFAIACDPERLLDILVAKSRNAYQHGRHYGKGLGEFLVGFSTAVIDATSGRPNIITGANYKIDENTKTTCAEKAARQELRRSDIPSNFGVLNGPSLDRLRAVSGTRPMPHSIHCCTNCRAINPPEMVIMSLNGKEATPAETLSVAEMSAYHDNPDATYPEGTNIDVRERAIEKLEIFCNDIVIPFAISYSDLRHK